MKTLVWKYGLLSALIQAVCMFGYWEISGGKPDFKNGMYFGFAGMFIALSMIFIGVQAFAKQKGDFGLSFGKAFTLGLLIALISAVGYAVSWMLLMKFMYPGFFDDYTAYEMAKYKDQGLPESELLKHKTEMVKYKELYQNPLLGLLITMTEVLPVGIIFALIAALIFKRKPA